MKFKSISNGLLAQSRKWLVTIAIAGTIMGVGASTVFRAGFDIKERTDLGVYKAAGINALTGKDIYKAENSRAWFFTSPPFLSILFISLAWGSLAWNALAFYAVTIGFLAWIARISFKLLPEHLAAQKKWKILGLSFFVCAIPFSDVATRGQIGILILLSLMLSLYGWIRRKSALCGLSLGFAIATKVTPAALLLIFFAVKQNWKIVLWTLAGLALFLIILPGLYFGFERNFEYLDQWLNKVPFSTYRIPATDDEFYSDPLLWWRQVHDPFILKNQSIYAVLCRLILRSREGLMERGVMLPRLLSYAVILILIVSSFYFLRKNRNDARLKLIEFSVPVAVLLISSPLAWSHYFSTLFPAYLGVFTVLETKEATSGKLKLLKWAVWLSVLFIIFGYAFKPLLNLGAMTWGTVILWLGMLRFLASEQHPIGVTSCSESRP
ncbi:MAG: DUF2029 domain-containing protein [Candidatus Omnitrophica bacterium]|nr:DUF2029 domain-containing protein [Candidatus Omnitrophota bacterium]